MYEFIFRGEDVLDHDTRPESVSFHRGSSEDFLRRHHKDAKRAVREGLRGVRSRASYLLDRIADARALRLAWDFLAQKGGQSPGPNGRRYSEYTSAEVWDLCRCLARALREGTYRPGPEKIVWLDKDSGRGQRPIVLLNIADRVVQRAITIIIQPLLDPLFDTRSFGYRPKLGHLHALATAESLTLAQRRRVWVTADVQDAFLHVPLSRLLDVLRKLLPADDLMELLERVLPGQELPGLRQGGSLSPLMLNAYLSHFLDRPWRRDYPRLPLLRVADDLLVMCRVQEQADEARSALLRFLRPAAMPLKETGDEPVRDLGAGDTAKWLGFNIRKAQRGLAVEIAERSWQRLERYLALAHTKNDAPLRAVHTIRQWLNQRGPCYPWSNHGEVCERILTAARQQAFEEVPGPHELQQLWQRAYARYSKLRKSVRGSQRSSAALSERGENVPVGD